MDFKFYLNLTDNHGCRTDGALYGKVCNARLPFIVRHSSVMEFFDTFSHKSGLPKVFMHYCTMNDARMPCESGDISLSGGFQNLFRVKNMLQTEKTRLSLFWSVPLGSPAFTRLPCSVLIWYSALNTVSSVYLQLIPGCQSCPSYITFICNIGRRIYINLAPA